MLGSKTSSLPAAEALKNPKVRRSLLWLTLILAVVVGICVAAPPTRTDALPWTGTASA